MRARPVATPSSTRRTKGSRTPGPVPHVMWNRGTELPCAVARSPPRSAHPTTGKKRMPRSRSHARLSPAANCRYASAHARGQRSSGRSKPAEPNQSCRASSSESFTPRRRCSGESTRNRPPNDHHACPPKLASGSCSTISTRLPASSSSDAATSPASPAPTTIASAASVVMRASPSTRPSAVTGAEETLSRRVAAADARPAVRVMPAQTGEAAPNPPIVQTSPQRLNPPSLVRTWPTIQAPSAVDSQPMSAAGSAGTPTRPKGVARIHSSSPDVSRSAVSGSM
ncbi:hypothetical protein QE428_000952 [Microbacterium sp. SORGH_AS 505]|nr:hypothetical protein [Microbacterium sp. SORGH_AS_0505]